MNIRLQSIVLLAIIISLPFSAKSAEIRLRQHCVPQKPVVTLGDVADVISADSKKSDDLKRIELFPVANADQLRVLRVRELQDLLASRGINMAEHRFAGSAQVQIGTGKKRGGSDQPLSEQAIKRAQRRVQEAAVKYLQEQSETEQPLAVQFELTSAQQRAAANPISPISLHGGNPPWTGLQRLNVTIENAEGSTNFPIEVRVNVPSSVVAAAHALQRGTILHASDLVLVHADPREDNENGIFHSIEEAAGQQTTKAIAEGKVLTSDAVQAPRLVRRGEVVTVYAKAAGIRIHTTARAKEEGAMGDLVAVESVADRKTFTARVCGPRETEVFAQAAQAE